MISRLSLLVSLVLACTASSVSFGMTFTQLDPSQTSALFSNLAADMAFRPVAPAGTLGTLWGLSLGVTGIQTSASPISAETGGSTSYLYNGDISAALQVPLGISVEAGLTPGLTVSGTYFNRFGIDGKWTFTEVFGSLPFNAAVRAMYTNASLSFSQPMNGGQVNVNYTTNMEGGQLVVSKKILIVEPWVAYGLISHNSSISGSGSSSLFDGNFPGGTSSTSGTGSGSWFQAGVELNLLLITVAAEYDSIFNNDSYAARVAFKF